MFKHLSNILTRYLEKWKKFYRNVMFLLMTSRRQQPNINISISNSIPVTPIIMCLMPNDCIATIKQNRIRSSSVYAETNHFPIWMTLKTFLLPSINSNTCNNRLLDTPKRVHLRTPTGDLIQASMTTSNLSESQQPQWFRVPQKGSRIAVQSIARCIWWKPCHCIPSTRSNTCRWP